MYTTVEFYEKKDSESSASNDMLFPGFPNNYFEDLTRFVDMELAMEQLSQNNNISILLYRIQNQFIINQKAVYDVQVLFSSSGNRGMNEYDAENFAIYRDYIQSENTTEILSETNRYILQQIFVNRLNASYIYLTGTMDNGDCVMLRTSIESIEESAQISNQFFIYVTICVWN